MKLGRIVVFPIKSLDGVERSSARITEGGILEGDRVYAIFDAEGRVVPFERWLSEFFGFAVTLRYDSVKGFPDDTIAFGPTLVSQASLGEVARWFPGMTIESARQRFRANLELVDCASFEEDSLFGPAEPRPFRLGGVDFFGHNPCQRCVVPSRDPLTGETIPKFQKSFAASREENLPGWAAREQFNHFYRFAVNTSISAGEAGKTVAVGDLVAT